ncbi:MAG: hypothetical protein MJ052_05245 [Sphaerochaetaceae bacterium]|nr:hypothetical protein [Sphaerochaetaceae bacterium]
MNEILQLSPDYCKMKLMRKRKEIHLSDVIGNVIDISLFCFFLLTILNFSTFYFKFDTLFITFYDRLLQAMGMTITLVSVVNFFICMFSGFSVGKELRNILRVAFAIMFMSVSIFIYIFFSGEFTFII